RGRRDRPHRSRVQGRAARGSHLGADQTRIRQSHRRTHRLRQDLGPDRRRDARDRGPVREVRRSEERRVGRESVVWGRKQFSSRRRHTRSKRDWSSDVCSSDLAVDGIDPTDLGFKDALRGGVTSALIKPGSGNPIGGRTAFVKTWGRIVDEMLVTEDLSVKSALGENPKRVYGEKSTTPSTRMGTAKIIRDAFVDARNYQAKRAHAEAEGTPFDRDLVKETLADVLDGKLAWD